MQARRISKANVGNGPTLTLPRLNISYLKTFVVDYWWMATYWMVASSVASNDKLSGLTGAICLSYAIFANALREQIYSFSSIAKAFAKCKTEFRLKDHPDYWQDIVSNTVLIVAVAYVLCHFGVMHCRFATDSAVRTMLDVTLDYWMINLIKDNTSMRYIHPWMHKKENYWMHKQHHKGTKDLRNFPHAFLFDVLDLMIEFGIGPVVGILVKYYVLGFDPSIHLVAFMFCIWTDGNIHSQNPYTQAIGNPFLDWLMKPNLTHNLHHAYQTHPDFMTVFPMHHITSEAAREADVRLYNKIMKTNVDFRIFLG